jgi:rhamnose transport system permease protein
VPEQVGRTSNVAPATPLSERERLTLPSRGRWVPRIEWSGPAVFLLALIVVFAVSAHRFLLVSNIRTVLLTAAILGVAAIAQTCVVLTRNLDLSIGSVIAASAYFPLLVYIDHPGIGWLIVPFALAIGGVLGAFNGLVVGYVGIPSIIATLGTMSLFSGAMNAAAGGKEIDTHQIPNWLPDIVNSRLLGLPWMAVLAVVVVAGIGLVLRRTSFGRLIYAVGSNADAAGFYGLPTRRTIFAVYLLAGVLAGVAGLMLAGYVGTVTVGMATGWELQTLAAAVLGGASLLGGSGTAAGAATGALIIATINNGLVHLGASGYWQLFVQGAAIVVAVGFDALLRRRTAHRLGRTGHGEE